MDKTKIANQTLEKYEEYVNPSLARLFRFMGLSTVEWQAEGSIIKDLEGHEYIDCLGGYGVFSLGHRHPKVVEAVRNQLELMPLSSKVLLNKPMADVSELLATITPGDLKYSFIGNSGAEAVEGALKLARLHTGRKNVVSAINSFHGKTFGALSATGRELFREPFEPLLNGFTHVPFGSTEALEQAVNAETAAVILEPIQGEGGIIVPPEDYLPTAREICDHYGALLICDEVQTGLGRTGRMFAVEHYAVVPDIMTVAKALGGGVMPIGAFIARPEVWQKYVDAPFLHTSTFGGNPLACAAAIAAIQVVREEKLPQKAAETGEYMLSSLQNLAVKYPEVISQVRGKGLMIGLDLTKEGVGGFLMAELINQGILVAYTLNNPKVIRIEPPLAISRPLVEKVLAAFWAAIEKAADIIEDL
ncbi:MAG: Acetylornithine/succinyldiaminopimelate aminotransferase [Firmicutes bacterium]|nr:Acetylornithine/succinyldiaminopimelate aminotransferase [Bacillota bacterium]